MKNSKANWMVLSHKERVLIRYAAMFKALRRHMKGFSFPTKVTFGKWRFTAHIGESLRNGNTYLHLCLGDSKEFSNDRHIGGFVLKVSPHRPTSPAPSEGLSY